MNILLGLIVRYIPGMSVDFYVGLISERGYKIKGFIRMRFNTVGFCGIVVALSKVLGCI